jgi:hypothetical protein
LHLLAFIFPNRDFSTGYGRKNKKNSPSCPLAPEVVFETFSSARNAGFAQMSVTGVMSSPSQRRLLLVIWVALIVGLGLAVLLVFFLTADSRGPNLILNFLLAFETSAIFALTATIFLSYYFKDPFGIEKSAVLLPQDIGRSLDALAQSGANYKIFVRTGRHFRASILPTLVRAATKNRSPVRVEVVLLDIRNETICDRYVDYRRAASFDKNQWDLSYLRVEILATVICLVQAVKDSGNLLDVDLRLSKRLSIYRIDGNDDEIIVTREDPKDLAFRYQRPNPHFFAFSQEFSWVKQEASKVPTVCDEGTPLAVLQTVLGDISQFSELIEDAVQATLKSSPYVQ